MTDSGWPKFAATNFVGEDLVHQNADIEEEIFNLDYQVQTAVAKEIHGDEFWYQLMPQSGREQRQTLLDRLCSMRAKVFFLFPHLFPKTVQLVVEALKAKQCLVFLFRWIKRERQLLVKISSTKMQTSKRRYSILTAKCRWLLPKRFLVTNFDANLCCSLGGSSDKHSLIAYVA